MSKKIGLRNKTTSNTSYPQKLQSNVSKSKHPTSSSVKKNFASTSNVDRSAVTKSKLHKKSSFKTEKTNEVSMFSDSVDNYLNFGMPEVLSIDSDQASSVVDAGQEVNRDVPDASNVIKQHNMTTDLKCISRLGTNGRESMKVLPCDITLCTPPRVANDIEQQKKVEQCPFFSSATPPVSADYIETVATRLIYSPPLDNVREIVTSSVQPSSKVESRTSILGGQRQTSEASADMKYTDLTHLQLKRSLDQIHGQNLRCGNSTGLHSNHVYTSVQSNVKPCYSRSIRDDPRIPVITPRSIGDPLSEPVFNNYSNYCSNVAFSCASSMPQSSKFDAIFQVKDAMLQEKEAVIVKLRLQISSLQHQLQESEVALRQAVSSHIPLSHSSTTCSQLHHNNDLQTQRKIYELEQLLGKAECKISEKTNYFKSERKEMEEKIDNLQEALKNKELSHLDLKKKHKLNVERMEKYKKRVECLERYLADLPTLEESNKLKTEAGILSEERESIAVDMSTLKTKYEDNLKVLSEKQAFITGLEKDNFEQMCRLKNLEDNLEKARKSKEELGKTERDELEDLRYELSRLRSEKGDAASVISGCEKRIKQLQEKHNKEMNEMKKKLNDVEEMNEMSRHGLLMKTQATSKVHSAVISLSSQNQELLEEKLTLQEKVKNLEKFHSNFRDTTHSCSRLQREIFAAASDLKAVAQVFLQTANGSDPNLSALLGVRSDTTLYDEDLVRRSSSGEFNDGDQEAKLEIAMSSEQTLKRLSDVRKIREDIDQLRSKLSNRYADNIGDNCVTQ